MAISKSTMRRSKDGAGAGDLWGLRSFKRMGKENGLNVYWVRFLDGSGHGLKMGNGLFKRIWVNLSRFGDFR